MDSDHDSGNSNDVPIHRRRTQGTRPLPSSHNQNSINRIASTNTNTNNVVDRAYHPTKDDDPYSDDDDIDEEDDEDEDNHQHRRHYQHQSTYRGRGRPSQHHQQHLMDSSYDETNEHHDLPKYTGPLRDQDRFLPIANIAKIMKKGVPPKGKIAKDAKETIQECVSEFLSFITSEASDRCLQEKRKTINGEDILLAMLTLGFDNYVEPLRTFLTKVRDASKYDRTITMGADLSEDLHLQVQQVQVNQTNPSINQQQVPNNNSQVQSQTTTATAIASGQTLPIKTNPTSNNPSGLEPYTHSVRVVTCIRNDQPGENPNYVYTIQPYQ